MKITNVKGVWYLVIVHECQVCGAGETFRKRKRAPRPENPAKRYEFHSIGCAGGSSCYSVL